jgi:hypothetical protein
MRKGLPLIQVGTLSMMIFGLATTTTRAETTFATSFDSANDLSSNFTIYGTNNNFSYSPSNGVGASGALDVGFLSNSDVAVVQMPGLAFTSSTTLTTSLLWYYDSARRDPFNTRSPLKLGFSFTTSPTSFRGGMVEVETLANTSIVRPTLWINGTGVSSSANYSHFMSGHWYNTTLTVTDVGGTFSEYDLTMTTSDCGTDGLQSPVPIATMTCTRQAGEPTLNGKAVWPAIYLEGQGGVHYIDNYSVAISPIPEPSTIALLLTATLGGLLLWRRRS